MSTFERSMIIAPKLLFWIAVAIFVLSLAGNILFTMRDGYQSAGNVADFIISLSAGLQAAFWPFVGAAVAWRMDRSVRASGSEAAE
jgi:hypothetical protein